MRSSETAKRSLESREAERPRYHWRPAVVNIFVVALVLGFVLLSSVDTRARLVVSESSRWPAAIDVVVDGVSRRVPLVERGPNLKSEPGHAGNGDWSPYDMRFHGITFRGLGQNLTNVKTGASAPLTLPHIVGSESMMGGWRTDLAISLGRTMLWVWAFDFEDAATVPGVRLVAFEVAEKGGKPIVLRQCELPIQGSRGVDGIRHGDRLLLKFGDSFTILDVRSWTAEPRREGHAAISDSGQVYWQDGADLRRWDHRRSTWPVLHTFPSQSSYAGDAVDQACKLDHDDVLLYAKAGLVLARSGKQFLPPPTEERGYDYRLLFVNPAIGVGLVWGTGWNPSKMFTGGALLSTSDLSRICAIDVENPTRVPKRSVKGNH